MNKRLFLLLIVFLIFGLHSWCLAAEPGQLVLSQEAEGDYWREDSVSLNVSSLAREAGAGTPLPLVIEVTNISGHPLVNGKVYLKILKQRKTPGIGQNYFQVLPDSKTLSLGYENLADQFLVEEELNLQVNEKKNINYTYEIPAYLSGGDYRLGVYFISAGKFYLGGVPFVENYFGGYWDFNVRNNELSGEVAFSKESTKVNGKPYAFVGAVRKYAPDEEIKIEAQLLNRTSQQQTVNIFKEMFVFRQADFSEQETMVLAPWETKTISWTVPRQTAYSMNHAVLRADWKDTHSILNISFIRELPQAVTINNLGLEKFPFKAGEELDIRVKINQPSFSSDWPEFFKQKDQAVGRYNLSVILKAGNGTLLAHYEYQGSQNISAGVYEGKWKADKSYNQVVLEGVVKNENGEVLNNSVVRYDCEKFASQACQADNLVVPEKRLVSVWQHNGYWLFIISALFFLMCMYYVNYKEKSSGRKKRLTIFLLATGGSMLAFLVAGNTALAGEKTVKILMSEQEIPALAYKSVQDYGSAEQGMAEQKRYKYFWSRLNLSDAGVIYSAQSSAEETVPLKKGEVFYIEDTTNRHPESVWWNYGSIQGNVAYGYWNNNADWVSPSLSSGNDLLLDYCIFNEGGVCRVSKKVAAAFVVNPPGSIFLEKNGGPVNCLKESAYRWKCTVTESFTEEVSDISLTLNYAPTYGAVYYLSAIEKNGKSALPGYFFQGRFQSKLNCPAANQLFFDLPFTLKAGSCSAVFPGNNYVKAATGHYPDTDGCFGNLNECNSGCAICERGGAYAPLFAPGKIQFNFAVAKHVATKPPAVPSCENCPEQLVPDEKGIFTFRAADQENNKLQFKISWDGDEKAEETTVFENSPRLYSTKHSFISEGLKDVKVQVCDDLGNCSAWADLKVYVQRDPLHIKD